MLSETPCMDKAGANVQLTITSLWLKLSDLDSGQVASTDIEMVDFYEQL